jgi:hypothetical protein
MQDFLQPYIPILAAAGLAVGAVAIYVIFTMDFRYPDRIKTKIVIASLAVLSLFVPFTIATAMFVMQ